MAFRDDRELLKQRIDELEAALSRAESRADRGELEAQVSSLVERVAAKRDDLEKDKKALAELAAELDQMARQLRPEEPPAQPQPAQAAQARSRGWMLLGLGVSMLMVCAGGFLLAAADGRGSPSTPALQGGAERLPGWPSALDPVALLPDMRGRGSRGEALELGSIEVRFLGSSGKLDVTGKGYAPALVYKFVHQPPAPAETARPLGVPAPPRPLATEYTVTIDRSGVVSERDAMAMVPPRPVAPPRCSTAQVWAAATAAGAPQDALATLRYRHSEGAARWSFEIATTDIRFEIDDGSCSVVARP